MSALLKLQVLQKLTTILSEIKIEAGFNTDCKGVWRGRTVFGAETPTPMIALLEAPRADIGNAALEDGTISKSDWTILVQGFAPNDPENPLDPAYRFLADVELQFGKMSATRRNGMGGGQYPEYYMLGGLINGLTLEQAVVRPPQEGVSATAFFYQPVRLTLVRDLICQS